MSSTTYTYSNVLTDLEDESDIIGSSGLTSSAVAFLTNLLQDVADTDGTASYEYSILNHVVSSAATTGMAQTAFNSLIGQWFLGTDDPIPLPGDTMVDNAGASLFPTDMATAYEHIDQGYNNGDCWLVATLIETAAVDPSSLNSMIWENANGTYGVRFCSPTGYDYLTVNADLMNNDDGAYSTDGSIWAGMLEKAFVEAQSQGLAFPMNDTDSAAPASSNNYNIISNGGWDEMLKTMTGRSTNYYQLSNGMALTAGGWIYDKILYNIANGIDVLFSSNTATNYGLVADHMFAVVGVDQNTGNYILFNPWGYSVTPAAEFEVTPQELYTLYCQNTGDEFLAADGAYYFNESALCHLAGTRILTTAGERPIESLRIGDEVVTRFGGIQRIKWIGEQHYDARFVAKNLDKIPVKITQGALGNGLPRRDLHLSPGHSLLFNDILVLAKDLVNGVTITQDQPHGEINYYNIELYKHDCVLAEGSWSETYADCADLRRSFHNAESFWALYACETAPADPVLCVPRPRSGAALTAVLAQVLSLAEPKITPSPAIGYVEQIGEEITGWAFCPNAPDLPVRLHIYAGQEFLGRCFALEDRLDVRDAGFGTGRSGFRYSLPPQSDPTDITVRCAASGAIIPLVDTLRKHLMAG